MKNHVLGLTGPTGAGKSTVAMELALEGCAIIDCDVLAHHVIENNPRCKQELAQAFGEDIVTSRGKINRKLLGARAFASKEQTERLNQITHPHILAAVREEIRSRQPKNHFVVLDAPTLIESGCVDLCDFTLVVLAPPKVRLGRIIQRDGLTEEEAIRRIEAQPDDAFYLWEADFLLDGTAKPQDVGRKVRTILKAIACGYQGDYRV